MGRQTYLTRARAVIWRRDYLKWAGEQKGIDEYVLRSHVLGLLLFRRWDVSRAHVAALDAAWLALDASDVIFARDEEGSFLLDRRDKPQLSEALRDHRSILLPLLSEAQEMIDEDRDEASQAAARLQREVSERMPAELPEKPSRSEYRVIASRLRKLASSAGYSKRS
jgi:hypothetical protein